MKSIVLNEKKIMSRLFALKPFDSELSTYTCIVKKNDVILCSIRHSSKGCYLFNLMRSYFLYFYSIEEDTYSSYSRLMLKYFVAQGVMSQHNVFLAGCDPQPQQLTKVGIIIKGR